MSLAGFHRTNPHPSAGHCSPGPRAGSCGSAGSGTGAAPTQPSGIRACEQGAHFFCAPSLVARSETLGLQSALRGFFPSPFPPFFPHFFLIFFSIFYFFFLFPFSPFFIFISSPFYYYYYHFLSSFSLSGVRLRARSQLQRSADTPVPFPCQRLSHRCHPRAVPPAAQVPPRAARCPHGLSRVGRFPEGSSVTSECRPPASAADHTPAPPIKKRVRTLPPAPPARQNAHIRVSFPADGSARLSSRRGAPRGGRCPGGAVPGGRGGAGGGLAALPGLSKPLSGALRAAHRRGRQRHKSAL